MGEEQSRNSEQDKALATVVVAITKSSIIPSNFGKKVISNKSKKGGYSESSDQTKSEKSVQVISGPIEEVDVVEETWSWSHDEGGGRGASHVWEMWREAQAQAGGR
jgi:hypothetical protein